MGEKLTRVKTVIIDDTFAVNVGQGYTLGEWTTNSQGDVVIKPSTASFPSDWEGIGRSLFERYTRKNLKPSQDIQEYIKVCLETKHYVAKLFSKLDFERKVLDDE